MAEKPESVPRVDYHLMEKCPSCGYRLADTLRMSCPWCGLKFLTGREKIAKRVKNAKCRLR